MALDPTEDDPELGQAPGGGPPPGGPPQGAGPPPGGPPTGGGALDFLARSRMGPQISAPGPGDMSDAMNTLNQAVQLMQHAAMKLPAGSPLHTDALKAVTRLSKHLGQTGSMGAGAGIQKTAWLDQLRSGIRNMMLGRIQQMAQGRGGQQGGQPGQGAMPQQAPMPATPLPGA